MVTPGFTIVVDECMSPWEGKEAKWSSDGMPQVTKIFRKPKGIGAELKAAADGESCVIIRLEIQEGKAAMAAAKYMTTHAAHTAITLRLVEPWFGTKRIIIGDSAFASLATCVALLSAGLFFMGIVKTASKSYPKAFFNAWEKTGPARGSTFYLVTTVTVNNVVRKIKAVGWKCKMVKTFISSVANCLAAVEQRLLRTKVVEENGHYITRTYENITSRVQVIYNLFRYFSVIDVHDHFRQGILALEEYWKTINWWHRLFATIMGMIYTNAYFYYRYDYNHAQNNPDGILSYEEFLGKLAFWMIHNELNSTNIGIQVGSVRPRDNSLDEPLFHKCRQLQTHPIWIANKENSSTSEYRCRSLCCVCQRRCSYYCHTCSTDSKCVSICNPNKSSCFEMQQNDEMLKNNQTSSNKIRRVSP